MKLSDYFLISVVLLHSCNAARYARQSENCPLIHAKDPSACAGSISECWSPGQYDVDCENGAGLCCFNGCVNVCGVPKVCKTVYETSCTTKYIPKGNGKNTFGIISGSGKENTKKYSAK